MTPAGVAYLALLIMLMPFGAHRLRLLWLRFRRAARPREPRWSGPLPAVTVQLPVYNEANVIERLIDAACSLDYPRDRLEVQVLDDSDDETVALAAAGVAKWRRLGVDARHVRRVDRVGFKAGALAEGVARARGEFLLVLDADFVPPRDLIRRLIAPFARAEVGAVQAAWGHLDEGAGWLKRAQAILLDAHFAIEHEARFRAGLFFNFNGSGGMWRRRCVESAGGWSADTLTEDVDLSYRAQLAGWRFVYLDDVRVPAELPATIGAVETQQERWTQGGIQSARKLLPAVLRAPVSTEVKIEACAHLLGHIVHPLTLLLGVSLAAAGWLGLLDTGLPGWIHGAALGLATIPFVVFYGTACVLRGRSPRSLPRRIGEALVLGLGLGVPLTLAVARGLSGRVTPFARTPKDGFRKRVRYAPRRSGAAHAARALMAVALLGAVAQLALRGLVDAVPFTGLFAIAYAAAALESFRTAPAHGVAGE